MRRLIADLLPAVLLIAAQLLAPQVGIAAPYEPQPPSLGQGPIDVVARQVDASVEHERVIELPVVASHIAIHWHGSPTASLSVAFATSDGSFGTQVPVELDDEGAPAGGGDAFSSVIWAGGARVVRVTSDQPIDRLTVVAMQANGTGTSVAGGAAEVAAIAQSPVISRAQWGANESYRFDAGGHEHWPASFYPVQKFVVHHTAGRNNDPDPAATVRAIYYYHAITRGWTDIGYNFLIDEAGRIYEGRHARDYAPGEVPTSEDLAGNAVRAGQVKEFNEGTVGIGMLGSFDTQLPTAAAQAALQRLLAWESERHNIDPEGYGRYTNPVTGLQKDLWNILGHRDVNPTACPGNAYYAKLPALRSAVAARIAAASGPAVDHSAPLVSSFVPMATTPTGSHTIPFGVIFNEPVTGLTRSDFSVGGTSTGWSVLILDGVGAAYTVTLLGEHPTNGSVVLRLRSNRVVDLADNIGPATSAVATASFAVDHVAPSVVLYPSIDLGGDPAIVDVTITFSEPVRGLTPGDVTLGGSSNGATPWSVSAVAGSGAHYAVTITRVNPATGTLTVVLPAGKVVDLARNPSLKSNTLSVSIKGVASSPYTSARALRLL